MDIRLETAHATPLPLPDRGKIGKKRALPVTGAPEDTEVPEAKAPPVELYKPAVMSKEELENFMLLLSTSKSSPRLFSNFIDEKRKDRIDLLLNNRV